MPETFELEIATPEKLVLREQVEEAQIPAENGYIGVLPEHSPLLSELGIGELSYLAGGRALLYCRERRMGGGAAQAGAGAGDVGRDRRRDRREPRHRCAAPCRRAAGNAQRKHRHGARVERVSSRSGACRSR